MQSSSFSQFSPGYNIQAIPFQGPQYNGASSQYSQGIMPPTTPTARTGPRRSLAPTPDTDAASVARSPPSSQIDVTMTSTYGDTTMGDDDPDGERAEGPVFHLPPPPESTYSNVEELDRALHAWSLEHGYELVRRASKKNTKGILYKRYYHCSKHGKLANTGKLTDATRVRFNRKSNRIGCPMSVAVVAVDPNIPDGPWEIRHRKNWHNHGPEDGLALAGHRRRAREGGVEKQVDGLFAINTPTASILQFLQRTNPGGLFTRTDVANMKLKYKKYGSCVGRGDNDRSSRAGDNMSEIASQAESVISVPVSTAASLMPPPPRPVAPPPSVPPAQATSIIADLQQYAAVTIAPTRLSLQSSSVEVLAASCCGNGESYRSVPVLEHVEHWSIWKAAFSEACMKENTYDVLVAEKQEPSRPPDDCPIDTWNEYIRQLAIYNRRNHALLGALMSKTIGAPKRRIQYFKVATGAWQALIDACEPRNSQLAFRLYDDLHNITLATSRNLRDYVMRLESAYNELNRAPHTPIDKDFTGTRRPTQPVEVRAVPPPSSIRKSGTPGAFSEDMLCFLFLRGLGPEYKRISDTICSTGNIGGFGTGTRLGYTDVTRSVIEWDTAQRGGTTRS